MKKTLLSLIVAISMFAFGGTAMADYGYGCYGLTGVTISGDSGVAMQSATGTARTTSTGLSGSSIASTTSVMKVRALGVGSSASATLIAGRLGCIRSASGSGYFDAEASGNMKIDNGVGKVTGKYSTSSSVDVSTSYGGFWW